VALLQWNVYKEFRDALIVQLALPLNLTDLAKTGPYSARTSWRSAQPSKTTATGARCAEL